MLQDSYVRVSQVAGRGGETFVSPQVQRQHTEAYARLHGHTIGRVFEELDASGGRANRPLLMEAIARQESGVAQVLCVARIDRLSRNLLDGLTAIRRITDVGGTFVAVDDGLDSGTPSGKLTLQLLLSLAEAQLDRVRANWADAQEQAVARGVFIGSVPLGYRRRANSRLAVDPITAPVAREAFQRRLAGATPTQLAVWLTEQGIPTPTGGVRWGYGTVKSLIGRRAYLGESTHGPFSNRRAHPPLIDAATWQAAQLDERRGPGPRTAQAALLRGLVRCVSCGRLMSTSLGEAQRLTYACSPHSTAGSCPRPASILDSMVEPYAEAVMLGQLRGQGTGRAQAAVNHAQAHVARTSHALAAYRDHPTLLDTLGSARFDAGLAVRREREETALSDLTIAREYAAQLRPGAAGLRRRWPCMDLAEKRDLIAAHLDCLMVFPGHGRDRLWAIPKGQQPDGLLPRAPRATDRLVPFEADHCQARALPIEGSLNWSRRKVTRALGSFLKGRDKFPQFAAFQSAGLGLLYANAHRLMATRKWAEQFSIRPPASACSAAGWSEALVRERLAAALAGWERWPTRREFADMNQSELRTAAQFHRGAAYWAEELRLPMRSRRPPRTVWTLAAMQQAVQELARDQELWPTRHQFSEAGLNGMYSQLLRSGARQQIAANLGLSISKGGSHRTPTRWTEQAVADTLDALLGEADSYPAYKQWQAQGLGGLHQRISRDPGGHADVAKRYGLSRRHG